MEFKNYTENDYEAVCDFLIALNQSDRNHINWNWARFEWMYEHPEFHKDTLSSIGLWLSDGKVAGAAIYDMYFGEGFCGTLPEYEALYPEILEYACRELRDDAGFGLAICDENTREIEAAKQQGFVPAEQTETVMKLALDRHFAAELPKEYSFAELDPAEEAGTFQWLLWQGFDHGDDKAEFEREETIVPQIRGHFNRSLSLAAANAAGDLVSYCCLWYHDKTDYAYVEPVCTVPAYRGKGIAGALVLEALNRAKELGAKKAYVISDLAWYEKLGFVKDRHFTFYWKKEPQ